MGGSRLELLKISGWHQMVRSKGESERPIRLDEETAAAFQIEQSLRILEDLVSKVEYQREQYIDLLQKRRRELMAAPTWATRAHNLQERTIRYEQHHWSENDNIGSLGKDAQELADEQSQVVPAEYNVGLAEGSISSRLETLHIVLEKRETFTNRMHRIEAKITQLRDVERDNLQRTQEALSEISSSVQQIISLIKLGAEGKSHAIIWNESSNALEKIQVATFEMSSNVTDETLVQLEERLGRIVLINETAKKLLDNVRLICHSREDFNVLLQQRQAGLTGPTNWIQRARSLQERAMRFEQENWSRVDRVESLWQDAQFIAKRQEQVVPEHYDESIPEETLSHRLETLQSLISDRQTLFDRMGRIESELERLRSQEKHNQQELSLLFQQIQKFIETIGMKMTQLANTEQCAIHWRSTEISRQSYLRQYAAVGSSDTPRTPKQLREHLIICQGLKKEVTRLVGQVEHIELLRERLIEKLRTGTEALAEAMSISRQIIDLAQRISAYNPANWPSDAAIQNLASDWKLLDSQQRQKIAGKLYASIEAV